MIRIVGAGEWLAEYGRVCKSIRWHWCWEKVWREYEALMGVVGECMYWIRKWWQRRKDLLYGEQMDQFWFPPSPSSMNSWTQHMHYYFRIFLINL